MRYYIAAVSASQPEMVPRRVLWYSMGLALVFVLCLGAFFTLKGRTTPLWLPRHPAPSATTP